jgi:ATP-dependent protease ClpP protease subunit
MVHPKAHITAAAMAAATAGKLDFRMQSGVMRLYIEGVIGWDVDAAPVVAALATPGISKVEVYMNSPGGSVLVGEQIAQALDALKVRKEGYVNGQAASMATVILMVCDTVEMTSGSMWLIHEARYTTEGATAGQLRQAADVLDRINERFGKIFSNRTGKTEEAIRALMAEDRPLTAKEAHEWGFVNKVTTLSIENFSPPAASGNSPSQPNPTSNTMDFLNKVLLAFAMAAGTTEDQAMNNLLAMKEKAAKGEKADELENRLQAFQAAQIKALLDAAETDKRIEATARPMWEKQFNNDFSSASELLNTLRPAAGQSAQASPPPPSSFLGRTDLGTGGAVTATNGAGQPSADRATWTMEDWMKQDSDGLVALKVSDPARFRALEEADLKAKRGSIR